ncbi:MAG TPA: aquaporin [Gemmatimonadaceae bacterium]|jgi:MIP family channel proteins|nr:aquaporin [Gemmatimonadaceae bacterium]
MRDAWRHFAAEFIGTFALVFVGSASIIHARITGSPTGLVEIAFAHGLILAVMVSALMRVSGHFNPAVTLSLLVTRRIEVMMAALYIVAQLIGAVAAGYALKFSFSEATFVATRGGGLTIALDVTGGQAFLVEAIATFFLVFAVYGTAVDLRGPKIGGLAVGLVVAADILAIGPMTGGSMNPARSFGPAVASGIYEAQLLYFAAPITGALIAGLLYEFLFMRRGREPVDHGELRP